MIIIGFETLMANAGLRNYLFIRLRTDTGLTGIGEASLEWQEKTVQPFCHEWVELVLSDEPGLGLNLDEDVIAQHPYVPNAFPSLWDEAWLAQFTGAKITEPRA